MKENEYKKMIDEMSCKITKAYNKLLDEKNIDIKRGIVRKINLAMASTCENVVATSIAEILKNRDYKYIIDCYISYGKKNRYRPDILIINKENTIVGIVEVKAQMGYCGMLDPRTYHSKLKEIKESKDEIRIKFQEKEYSILPDDLRKFYDELGYDKKNKLIKLKLSHNAHLFIVNVLSSNHTKNVEGTIYNFENNKEEDVQFYSIFGQKVWYNEVSYTNLFSSINGDEKTKYNFKQFCLDLNKYVKDTRK